MILVAGSTINVFDKKENNRDVSVKEILNNDEVVSVLTMYSKVTFEPYKNMETMFNYIPYISVFEKTFTENAIKLSFKNNYDEIEKSITLTPDHKVYTLNKGYVSVDNLGMMDVLVDTLGHICSIINKETILIKDGEFFNMNLKFGNNIIVNDLIVTPK